VLILIGGILMIVLALVEAVGSTALSDLFRDIPMAYGLIAGMGVLVDLAGVLAIVGSRRAYSLIWAYHSG